MDVSVIVQRLPEGLSEEVDGRRDDARGHDVPVLEELQLKQRTEGLNMKSGRLYQGSEVSVSLFSFNSGWYQEDFSLT